MAITVNFITGEIFVPRADMTLIQASPEIRGLDINAFRLELSDIMDNPDGRPWPRIYDHETETLLEGEIYARKVIILAPYFITFEAGLYAVKLSGANANISEVATVNGVSVRSFNSTGLTAPWAKTIWDYPLP